MEVYGHCVRLRPSVASPSAKGSYKNAKAPVPENVCWTLSVPGYLPDESPSRCTFAAWGPSNILCSVEKSLVASKAISKGAEIYGNKKWGVWTNGRVQLVRRHRISTRQHDRSNRAIDFGSRKATRVKSFVDEATANSADTGLDSPSVISERSDGEGSEATLDSADELQGAAKEQEGKEEDKVKYGSGTKASEAGSTPSVDYSYEDMKLDQRRNWSMVDMKKLDQLRNFEYRQSDEKGVFVVQTMRIEHMRVVQELLVDSFAELMGGLLAYRPLLALTVRQYVQDRFLCLPDVVTLVGLYAPAEEIGKVANADDGDGSSASSMWRLAGTVELSFTDFGHPDVPAGPQPPRGSPYLCNMAISRDYRRRGLGRQLLKAAENMTRLRGSQDLYLHCRLIDSAPLNMYKGSGFQIVATDSFLSLLSFQRRRHLMHKRLKIAADASPVENGHSP